MLCLETGSGESLGGDALELECWNMCWTQDGDPGLRRYGLHGKVPMWAPRTGTHRRGAVSK